jgi:hypothetical protein
MSSVTLPAMHDEHDTAKRIKMTVSPRGLKMIMSNRSTAGI